MRRVFFLLCRTGVGLWARVAFGWMVAVSGAAAGAEEFQVRGWHVEDGLPDGTVTALAQTSEGFLWVGTAKGLVRFDGVRFSRVPSDRAGASPDLGVLGLLAGEGGSLWIISQTGVVTQWKDGALLVRYMPSGIPPGPSPRTNLATQLTDRPGAEQTWQAANVLARDARGFTWALASTSRLLCFGADGLPQVLPTNGLPEGPFYGICADASGGLWAGKGDSLCHLRNGGWKVFDLPADFRGDTLLLCAGSRQGLWAASAGGVPGPKPILLWDSEGQQRGLVFETRRQLSVILQDHEGRIWLSDWWGGLHFGREDGSGGWQSLSEPGALGKAVITCLLEDRQGSVWAGTVGEGLHRVTRRRVQMIRPPTEMADVPVTAVCVDPEGGLWIGSGGKGLCRWKDGRFERYGTAEGLPGNAVDAVVLDPEGRVWVSANDSMSVRTGSRFEPVREAVPALASISMPNGEFWLGGASRVLQRVAGTNAGVFTAPDQRYLDIRGLAKHPSGTVWAAAYNSGVWAIEAGQLTSMNQRLGLDRTDARTLLWDQQGVLWIGTLAGGLFRWDGRQTKHYQARDGLPDESIIGLAEDEGGNLWMASANGIFGCSRASLGAYERGKSPRLICWQLGLDDGLANRGCSGGGQSVMGRDTDGVFWVANMVGAAGFDPAEVTRNRLATNAVVEAVLTDGIEQAVTGSEVRVSTSVRRFEFQFTTPELLCPQMLHFRYRLDGLDPDWVDAGTARSASYSRLPGGLYRFRVMVSGGEDVWREGTGAVALRVIPYLWELRWVQALALVLFIGAIGGALAWNQRRQLHLRIERLELQHSIEKERARIARDIHDHLGASLTQIALMSEASSGDTPVSQHAETQLTRIATKARSVVQMLNGIVWAVNPKNDNLPKLLDYLCSMTEELCETAGVRCWHEVPTGLSPTPLQPEVRHNIALSVREAVNNALKHSGAPAIWVRVVIENARLQIEVEDCGRGFDPESVQARGNGLNNIRTRIEQLGGRVEFLSRLGAGTKVRMDAPLPG